MLEQPSHSRTPDPSRLPILTNPMNDKNRIIKNCNEGGIGTVIIKGLCYKVCVLGLPCGHYIIIYHVILLGLQRQELGIHNATGRDHSMG